MRAVLLFFCVAVASAVSQLPETAASVQTASISQMNFLLGTWSARTVPTKASPALVLGEYTFRTDILKTVVTRVSATDACLAPQSSDCQHYDALTVYHDAGDPTLHALYLDSQGHTIHYDLSFPDATTAIFFSTGPGTQYRLVYHLQKNILTGKYQTAPPGSTNFVSSLEWFGVRMSANDAARSKPAAPHALDALVNTTRAVLLFAPQSADPQFQQQLNAFSGRESDLADRNLVVIPILALWTPIDKSLHDRNLPFTSESEQQYAREHFKVAPTGFTMILVGKDGGEKLRSRVPLSASRLFGAIDEMPMRREEMRTSATPSKPKATTSKAP